MNFGVETSNERLSVPELLAPAGNLACLAAAVAAGADAIYLGLGKLNARVSAAGFSWEELARGCALAHTHGARVYGALNIFIFDSEFDYAHELVERALTCGIDAFIVADFGLIDYLIEKFPGIEIHLSTQAAVHSPEGLRFVSRELGVQRACVARELSVGEIAELCKTGVPVETFVHGAICISYSGECSFSALCRGRSAMRGDCTQPCRASYDLVDGSNTSVVSVEGDKLLCPRDYLGIAHLEELCKAGVHALKIEGRMKNPDYVYNVVSVYREALDCIEAGKPYNADALTERLGRSFNRGFTDIYLCGAKADGNLMSFERSINQGVRVGRVVERTYQKIYVLFDKDVHAGDTLEVRFYPGENTAPDAPKRWPMISCPVDAKAGETIFMRCKRKVEVGSEVYLTKDSRLVTEAQAAIEKLLAEKPDMTHAVSGPGAITADAKGAPSTFDKTSTQEAATNLPASTPSSPLSNTISMRTHCDSQEIDKRRSSKPVEEFEGEAPPSNAVVLDEILRNDNRDDIIAKIADAAARGREIVCRNIGQVELCREAGASFSIAKPIFCSNSRAEALLKEWGATSVYRNDHSRQLMVMEHCVLTAEGPCAHDCKNCQRRQEERYLIQQVGSRVRVLVDHLGRSRLYLCD